MYYEIFLKYTRRNLYTMCNAYNSCKVCNTGSTYNGGLCSALWNLLLGNCVSSANENGNGNGNGCCNHCQCCNPCRRTSCCTPCCNHGSYCGFAQNASVSTTSSFDGDLYYAYQYGLIPRNGGVCRNTNSCCNSCNAY